MSVVEMKKLKNILADIYQLIFINQSIHWNYSGCAFFAVHEMTEAHYRALFDTVDELAERIRALGYPVALGGDFFTSHATFEVEEDVLIASEEALVRLNQAYGHVIDHVAKLRGEVYFKNDDVTIDLLIKIEKDLAHFKWMLRSSIEI